MKSERRAVGGTLLPPQLRILSGSTLKLIAVITMLIDHIGAHILGTYAWAREPLFKLPWETVTWYSLSRGIGRIAFPIYCFLLVEGFMHTRSRVKYACNLFLFACISEIPWNYVHSGTLTYNKQNVFFTLLLGYLGICALGGELPFFSDRRESSEDVFEDSAVPAAHSISLKYSPEKLVRLLMVLVLLYISMRLRADYGWRGYLFILIMYGFRNDSLLQAIIGGGWLYYEWKADFAFIFINMYNGKRGFIRGRLGKYFFYLFYPLHLLILGWLKFH